MYFIVLGVLLLILKVAEVGPVGMWSWWIVLSPFAAAVVWWAWADATGYTKRREIKKMDERRDKRRARNLESLGLAPKRRRDR